MKNWDSKEHHANPKGSNFCFFNNLAWSDPVPTGTTGEISAYVILSYGTVAGRPATSASTIPRKSGSKQPQHAHVQGVLATFNEVEPIDNKHLLKEIETRWRELWPRLLVFGHSIVSSSPWCTRVSGEDLVREAVLRVARGTRVWNPETSGLDSFLFGVVVSCACERPRQNENEIPHLDYELLEDNVGSLEPAHHQAFHRERKYELSEFVESLRDDPPAYNVASYMVKFGVDQPDQLASILVMDKDKVIATKRRIMRRAVKWQYSSKKVDERYRARGDE